MKKKIFFLFILSPFQLLTMNIHDAIVNRLDNDINTRKIVTAKDLSPELRKTYLDFIPSVQPAEQGYKVQKHPHRPRYLHFQQQKPSHESKYRHLTFQLKNKGEEKGSEGITPRCQKKGGRWRCRSMCQEGAGRRGCRKK